MKKKAAKKKTESKTQKQVKEKKEEKKQPGIISAQITFVNGIVRTLRYDPPLSQLVFHYAFSDHYFVYRVNYPSYRKLIYIPVNKIDCIEVEFENTPKNDVELSLAT